MMVNVETNMNVAIMILILLLLLLLIIIIIIIIIMMLILTTMKITMKGDNINYFFQICFANTFQLLFATDI